MCRFAFQGNTGHVQNEARVVVSCHHCFLGVNNCVSQHLPGQRHYYLFPANSPTHSGDILSKISFIHPVVVVQVVPVSNVDCIGRDIAVVVYFKAD